MSKHVPIMSLDECAAAEERDLHEWAEGHDVPSNEDINRLMCELAGAVGFQANEGCQTIVRGWAWAMIEKAKASTASEGRT